MLRSIMRLSWAPALALVSLLMFSPDSQARWGWGTGNWGPARAWDGSWGTPYWGGYTGYYGNYWTPGSVAYGNLGYYGWPSYYGGTYSYVPYRTYTYVPYNSGTYAYSPSTSNQYYSFYPSNDMTNMSTPEGFGDNAAHFRLHVPANAEIWFGGHKTSQMGPVRDFSSPPLTPGKNYRYDIRARWTENGKTVDRTWNVDVHAGEFKDLDLMGGSLSNNPVP